MIDINLEPVAPQIDPKKSHHLAAIAIASAAVLLVALAGYAFHEHSSLTKSQAHAASVTIERDQARGQLKTTQSDLSAARSEADSARATVQACEVAIDASRHMTRAAMAATSALNADVFSKLGYLQSGITHLRGVNQILEDSGYDSIWDLYNSCDQPGFNA